MVTAKVGKVKSAGVGDLIKFRPRQLRFVAEYVQCRNASKAAKTAGYKRPVRAGVILLNHPGLRRLINEQLSASLASSVVSRDWVIAELAGIVERSRQRDPSVSDGVRALEHLGRHLGLFVDRHQVAVGSVPTKVVVLDDGDGDGVGDGVVDVVDAEPSRPADTADTADTADEW